jgi:hypothetical protein
MDKNIMPQLKNMIEKNPKDVRKKHFHLKLYSIVSVFSPENGARSARPAEAVHVIKSGL